MWRLPLKELPVPVEVLKCGPHGLLIQGNLSHDRIDSGEVAGSMRQEHVRCWPK